MKRDHQKIDNFVQSTATRSEEIEDVGCQMVAMGPDDAAFALVKAGERAAGREMAREDRDAIILQMANWYENVATALRRLAAGPQLRLVPPLPSDAAGED